MHLLEGAKISQQLLRQALSDPNYTFGIEVEFFLVGARTFIQQYMSSGSDETVEIGGDEFFVKKLGDVTWYDFVHFFTPLGVSKSSMKHNHEILRDRLFGLYQNFEGVDLGSDERASVPPADVWNELLGEYRVHEMMALLRAFPEHRMLGIDESNVDVIREIVYDGHVDEIEPFGKLNNVSLALGHKNKPEKDFDPSHGHATRDAFYNLVSKDIGEKLGVRVAYTTDSALGYHVSNEHQEWFITEDSSLGKTEEENDVIGVELVSPVMQASEGMAMLDKVLAMMNGEILGLQVATTEKTGLHVNLGVRGKDIDAVKILVLSGDEYITKKFDRATSENAASIQAEVQRRMQAAAQGKASTTLTPRDLVQTASKVLQGIKADPKDLHRAIEVLNSLKPEGKSYSINFAKLASGYVEYRNIGNAGYHRRPEEVKNAILHMIGITYIATDPDAYRQEFLKKLYSMVQRALQDVPIMDGSNTTIGRQPGMPGGYGSQIEQYRDTPYDGENYVQYGFDSGSDTQ